MAEKNKLPTQDRPSPVGSADHLLLLSNGPSLPSVPAPRGPDGLLSSGSSRTTAQEAPAELEAFQTSLEEEEEEELAEEEA